MKFFAAAKNSKITKWVAGEIINIEQEKNMFQLGKRTFSDEPYLIPYKDDVSIFVPYGLIILSDGQVKPFAKTLKQRLQHLTVKHKIPDILTYNERLCTDMISSKSISERIIRFFTKGEGYRTYFYNEVVYCFEWVILSPIEFFINYSDPYTRYKFLPKIFVDVNGKFNGVENNTRFNIEQMFNFKCFKNLIFQSGLFTESIANHFLIPAKYAIIAYFSLSDIGLKIRTPKVKYRDGAIIMALCKYSRNFFEERYDKIKNVYQATDAHRQFISNLFKAENKFVTCTFCNVFLFDEVYINNNFQLFCPICIHIKANVRINKDKMYKIKIPISLDFLLENLNITLTDKFIFNSIKSHQPLVQDYYCKIYEDIKYMDINNIIFIIRNGTHLADFLEIMQKQKDKKIVYSAFSNYLEN